jgi:hypothetical protein
VPNGKLVAVQIRELTGHDVKKNEYHTSTTLIDEIYVTLDSGLIVEDDDFNLCITMETMVVLINARMSSECVEAETPNGGPAHLSEQEKNKLARILKIDIGRGVFHKATIGGAKTTGYDASDTGTLFPLESIRTESCQTVFLAFIKLASVRLDFRNKVLDYQQAMTI